MKKLSKIVLFFVALVFWVAGSAMASPSNLKDIIGIEDTDVYIDTGAECVQLTHTAFENEDATAFLFLEVAGWSNTNTFGIYDFNTNPDGTVNVGNKLEVFNGPSSPLTSATLQWDLTTNTVTNQSTGASATIDTTFGFYLDTAASGSYPANTWYSHTSANVENDGQSRDHVMLFDTTGNSVGALLGSDIVLAFEDLDISIVSDLDYNDMVVGISDVAPSCIPDPGLHIPAWLSLSDRFWRSKKEV